MYWLPVWIALVDVFVARLPTRNGNRKFKEYNNRTSMFVKQGGTYGLLHGRNALIEGHEPADRHIGRVTILHDDATNMTTMVLCLWVTIGAGL